MPENTTDTSHSSVQIEEDVFEDDDIPDMSTPYWAERIKAGTFHPGTRGRPKSDTTKTQTTLRLDPDVIDAFKADGPGWQSRMNAALRKAAGL